MYVVQSEVFLAHKRTSLKVNVCSSISGVSSTQTNISQTSVTKLLKLGVIQGVHEMKVMLGVNNVLLTELEMSVDGEKNRRFECSWTCSNCF